RRLLECIRHRLLRSDGRSHIEWKNRKKGHRTRESGQAHCRVAREWTSEIDVHSQHRCGRKLFGIVNKDLFDVIVIGAGPTGLAATIEAKKNGLKYLLLDKGGITNSILHFPVQMIFFTTPELLEIGGIPLVSDREKPSRNEALKYYRK